MKNSLDFERWQPPAVTEEMLLAERQRRKRRRRLVWIYGVTLLYLAAALVCAGCLSVISVSYTHLSQLEKGSHSVSLKVSCSGDYVSLDTSPDHLKITIE